MYDAGNGEKVESRQREGRKASVYVAGNGEKVEFRQREDRKASVSDGIMNLRIAIDG